MEGVLRASVPWGRFALEARTGARILAAVFSTLLVLILAAPIHVAQLGAAGPAVADEGALLTAAAAEFPESFGGAWRAADGSLVLGFTDRAQEAVEQLVARLGDPSVRVSAQLVRFSLTALLAVDQQMYDLATAAPGLPSVPAWSVRPESNRIVAYVESPEQARRELTAAGVDVEKVVFAQPGSGVRFAPMACTRTSCASEPTRGGLSWYTSRGGCTTGFGATRNGTEGFISAGHCGAQGATAFLGRPPGGTEYGPVTRSVQSGSADGSFVERDFGAAKGASGEVYVSSSDPQHHITAEESSSGYVKGDTTCFSGMTSGYHCGTIADGAYTNPSLDLRDVVLTSTGACGSPGDSGAPYFDGGSTGQGILSGDLLDEKDRCVNGIYTKLSHVESALGARIVES